MANIWSGKKGKKSKPDDFMPKFGKPEDTSAQKEMKFRVMAGLLNQGKEDSTSGQIGSR